MGSFLEFIFSNSPIYFLQILFILYFLLDQKYGKLSNQSAAPSIGSLERATKKMIKKQNKKNWRK